MTENSIYRVLNLTSTYVILTLLDQEVPRQVSLAPYARLEVAHLSYLGAQVLAEVQRGTIRVLQGDQVITTWIPKQNSGAPTPPPDLHPPVITSSDSDNAFVSISYSYQITATNSPSSFDATGLPDGLSVDTGTGLISGVPTTDGTFDIDISATNSDGTGHRTLTLVVTVIVEEPPVFTFPLDDITIAVGEYRQIDLTVADNPLNPPTFDVSGLPDGMFSTQLTPTPPYPYIIYNIPITAGDYVVSISATNIAGTTGPVYLTIHVVAPTFQVSGTGTQFDDIYVMTENQFYAWDYETQTVQIQFGYPSALSGSPYVFRAQNNSNLAIFYMATYDIWAIADLSIYAGGPPECALYPNVSSVGNVMPPEGGYPWQSPSGAPVTVTRIS